MIHKDTDITLYLIRHAECEANLNSDCIGGQSWNSQLTQKGRKQAKRLGRKLREISFDRVYSSPQPRALETAKISIPNYDVSVVINLRELDQGDFEGKLRTEVYIPEVSSYRAKKGKFFVPPNGESQRQVERRVSNWVEDEFIWNPAFRGRPFKFAIFSHGIALKSLLHYVMGFNDRFIYRMTLGHASITQIQFTKEAWYVHQINDVSYLNMGDKVFGGL